MSTELKPINGRHLEQVVWVRDSTKVLVLKVSDPLGDYEIVVRFGPLEIQQHIARSCHLQVLPHGAIVQETGSQARDTQTVDVRPAIETRLIEGNS